MLTSILDLVATSTAIKISLFVVGVPLVTAFFFLSVTSLMIDRGGSRANRQESISPKLAPAATAKGFRVAGIQSREKATLAA